MSGGIKNNNQHLFDVYEIHWLVNDKINAQLTFPCPSSMLPFNGHDLLVIFMANSWLFLQCFELSPLWYK